MSSRFDMIDRNDELEVLSTTGSKGPPKGRSPVAKKPAPLPAPQSEDDRDVFTKIAADVYRNKLPYERFRRDATPEQKERRDAYQAEEARLTDLFKKDLYEYCGVQNNPRREECFSKAWEMGHASGFNDVAVCFTEIVDLICPATEERNRLTMTEDEEYAAFAALCAMVENAYAIQDGMTNKQWKAAEALYRRLEERVNARQPAPRRRRRKS